jgi:hypothetical protein
LRLALAAICCGAGLLAGCGEPPRPRSAPARPIIDMHLHAHTLAGYGGGGWVCTNDQPIDEAVMNESLGALDRHNIWAVTSGSLEAVGRWKAARPARVIPAISFGRRRIRETDLVGLRPDGLAKDH